MNAQVSEPWLRGTLTDVAAVQRAVLHALELAGEDLHRWCDSLTDEEVNRAHGKIASVAFQLRHIVGSIDRLLTYAEEKQLSAEQLEYLKAEDQQGGNTATLMAMLDRSLAEAAGRIRAFSPTELESPRVVGKKQLPATLGGLLVHVADHTQRHVGQAIVTAKLARG
ncbi:hypothetical protein Acid345_1671 [Candidatus Koribacter versatilis Ellin345]|uniref:DinB-like domain-containing protein n=1 Tax=Koribacter versatilis (strain Ellin345) TaxID=204669 RepID=Q1IR28_KORVE|nr:DinB family protein [Candidatus Koribacter versatilis]ABF40672.1 hypothetical protein Acid345_1671 [Candidatus Koribacter versatilis Ellin345]